MDYADNQGAGYSTLGASAARPPVIRENEARLTRIENLAAGLIGALGHLRDRIDPQPHAVNSGDKIPGPGGLCSRLSGIESRLEEAAAILRGIEELI